MIKYLLIFLLSFSVHASKILSYNIYDRTDRADVMITFDTPFSGKITQNTIPSKIIIKLDGVSIESPKIKKVGSNFLESLSITPMSKETQIIANVPSDVKFIASKTSDGYGLRLRFKKQANTTKTSTTTKIGEKVPKNILSTLPTKKDEGISRSYYIVVGFLILGILTLFYFQRKIQTNQKMQNKQGNWLFKANQEQVATPPSTQTSFNEASIRFQKSLDNDNSVLMLDFGTQSYLVLMGKSNILLDKFSENIPTTEQEFHTILQSRHEQLEQFLGDESSYESEKEPLQAYKERAASLYNQES